MFSYLRPHRRTPSAPPSPLPDQPSEGPTHPTFEHALLSHYQDGIGFESSAKSAPPQPLPPTLRVTSLGADVGAETSNRIVKANTHDRESRAQNADTIRADTGARDINTINGHPRLPATASQRPESAGNSGAGNHGSHQHPKQQTSKNQELLSRPRLAETNIPYQSAPELQRPVVTGRRATGARLPTPPSGSNPISTFESAQPRSGKRLNLLNPMSLLARRRTSQAVTQLSAESLVSRKTGNTFNESFDPRIRGTVVHDFSAPRPPPRKAFSTQDIRSDNTAQKYQPDPALQSGEASAEDAGRWSGGNHTPVFTENFEEEQYPAAGPHVRKANDISDLPLPRLPYANGAQKPLDPVPIARSKEEEYQAARRLSARTPVSTIPPPVPPKSEDRADTRRISIDPTSSPPKQAPSPNRPTPSSSKRRSRNASEVSIRDGAIPRHMKSTSSRFSFDMIGAAEQERLLEDRHRKKELERKSESPEGNGAEEEYQDDYDYDDMMDDDGLEEPIPMIDNDYDEETLGAGFEEEIPEVNTDSVPREEQILDDHENLAGFKFRHSAATPLSPYSPGLVSTPRDANGEVIGFALTKNSPYPTIDMAQEYGPSPILADPPSLGGLESEHDIQGLGLQGLQQNAPEILQPTESSPEDEYIQSPVSPIIDDDDLYFDDGMIDEPEDGETENPFEFDESVFDNIDTDQYGRPLKAFSSQPTLYSPPNIATEPPSTASTKVGEIENGNAIPTIGKSDLKRQTFGGLAPQASDLENPYSENSLPRGLTQDSLAAYQEALAAAAFSAAANGKFRRDSIQADHTASDPSDAQPDLIPDSSHTLRYDAFSPSYDYEDDFDYDDALEDDPIIAAANAEALAYDTDGFYGQEFGFYSAPASGEVQYANGGYFGPRGGEGIGRSQSGRVVSREPNLTPITERSEYSNRNSMMSMSMYPQGQGNVTSPGLAQLAGLMSYGGPEYEGDMSLNALLKLRRGAWGGSQASLHSSTGGGSPRSAGGADETSPGGHNMPLHRRANSANTFSLVSEAASETSSAPGSPTLTMNVEPTRKDVDVGDVSISATEHGNGNGNGTKNGSVTGPPRRHRYTGSADSFSYAKEDDPASPTGEVWVLERRRTSELGEELLEREVISGGRI